ncbi:MAG: SDR family NAD(P)-dependent oxidoreductase [Chitinophaga sp.]|uniref:SDR family NAD(P)-dependent oxidoreductase n=1 Tax=Chitinophaga sp. TaxID=1869181 RepID=UPI001AFFD3A4|nr:SDR family NAD(P)-dependent oxidoreductase [Chitinophaga sp.]MBO9732877.1 SDR family NAD(P)-dependent oxidoreductase [Chitinophaga sp.]
MMSSPPLTAVVTGGSSGIGFALTQKLLSEGYHVFATSRSGDIPGIAHPALTVIPLDITDSSMVQAAVAAIAASGRGIDLLVNNAGAAPDVYDLEPKPDTFTQTFATNVTGLVFFTETLLPHLHQGAQIVMMSSAMGLIKNAGINGPAYRMSKAAVNMYAVMLAKRLSEKQIRVTPMHPGWVKTKLGGMNASLTPRESAEVIYAGIRNNSATGQFWNTDINGVEMF